MGSIAVGATRKGKLEKSWKRFEQIVLKPGYRWYGKARVWQEETLDTSVSLVWDKGCEQPWLLISEKASWAQTSARICLAHAGGSDLSIQLASTSKPAGLKTGPIEIAYYWHCFWRSGGPHIWQQPVFIMGSVIALIGWTDETRVSFA